MAPDDPHAPDDPDEIQKTTVVDAHIRLNKTDVELLKKLAEANGVSWQTELRMLVRRTLNGESRPIAIIKD
jgi:predicted DNA binding CopG/RHH family protein